jgi:hypothetical protein
VLSLEIGCGAMYVRERLGGEWQWTPNMTIFFFFGGGGGGGGVV